MLHRAGAPHLRLLKEGRLSEGRACWCSAPYASWWWSKITM